MSRRRFLLGNYDKKPHYPGYKVLEYFETSNTLKGYFNFSSIYIGPNNNIRYTIDAQLNPPSNTYSYYVGIFDSATSPKIYYDRIGFSNSTSGQYKTYSPNNSRINVTYYRNSSKKGVIIFDGTTITGTNTANYGVSMCIPGYFSSSSSNQLKSDIKVYNVKIENGGTLIYNFIPAERESDSKIGLLDTINMSFYLPYSGTIQPGPYV